jgi:hypothetical protein
MQCNTATDPLLPGLEVVPGHGHAPWITARKPVGGYMFLTVSQLCLLWWLYWSKQITPLDLRVWFTCQELRARRCQLAPGQIPDYTVDEVRQVLRLRRGPHHIRASLDCLQDLGLMTLSPASLRFATSPTDLQARVDLTGYHAMIERIDNKRRRVPVPRQIVRLIVQGCGRIRLATLLGHLLRCLYYRDGRCVSGGRCKASWIATVFGVDRRHVKGERKHLLAIGVLQAGPQSKQQVLNRHGPKIYVSLTWTQAGLREAHKRYTDVQEQPATRRPPPPACAATWSPPPYLNQKPLQELGRKDKTLYQKPAQADPAPATVVPPPEPQTSSPSTPGIEQDVEDDKAPVTISPPSPPRGGVRSSEGKVTAPIAAHHFTREQLEDTAYLVEVVFPGAVKARLCHDHWHDLLQVLTLADHALLTAQDPTNPGAQFAANLRQPRWYGSEANEATARVRYKLYEDGQVHRAPPPPPPSPPPALSDDARFVDLARRVLQQDGWRDDPFIAVKKQYSEWTRARWDTACSELAQAQHHWQQVHALSRLTEVGIMEDWRVPPPDD